MDVDFELSDRLPIFLALRRSDVKELWGGAGFKNSHAYGPGGWIRLTVIRYESSYSQQFNPSLVLVGRVGA